MMDKCVRDILIEWKNEAKISHLMLYKLRGGVLTIYTDRPGPLIGYQGKLVIKYEEKLSNLPHQWVKSIEIEETTGIF